MKADASSVAPKSLVADSQTVIKAVEASLDFAQEEWELDQMQKLKEMEEAAADEDDEVLYYEVAAPKGLPMPPPCVLGHEPA